MLAYAATYFCFYLTTNLTPDFRPHCQPNPYTYAQQSSEYKEVSIEVLHCNDPTYVSIRAE